MSPIYGLTTDIKPRFPRLGKLKKGGEKVKGGYGPDLDHFRFTSDSPEILEAFQEAYGEKPVSIPVYIPAETPEEAFPTWAELWGASGLVHRCDGQNMTIWLEGGKYLNGSKPCPGGHRDGDPKNDAVGRLGLILPGLIEAGYVGTVTLETHSKNDIIGILSVLQATYNARHDLRGILFNLRRVQESITTPGFGDRKGQRSRTNKWLVRLEPAADWMQMQLELARAAQMGQLPGGERPALPAGDDEPEYLDLDPSTGEILPPAGNGNGRKSNSEKVAEAEKAAPPAMTLEKALETLTPKGVRFGDLTVEQLKQVVEKSIVEKNRQAALLLMGRPDAPQWERWSQLVEDAAAIGIAEIPTPADETTAVELYRMYERLAGQVRQPQQ